MKTVKQANEQVDKALRDAVTIVPEVIQEEFARVPADLAYWNAQYASALRSHLLAKHQTESGQARLRIEHRERLNAEGGKVTESMVDAAVELDPAWDKLRMAAIEAEVQKARVSGVCEAIRAKKDMLMSLGSHLRVEMENDPSLRERVSGRRMVEDSKKSE